MMHNNNFVFSVKSQGKVLREFGDTVYVPFGSEFSLFFKNLNNRRASVKVSVDGQDVLNGSELIVNANDSVELERYLKDLNKGNRFKFIERTSNIEDHRGVQAEDGLIRIEFAYEKQYIAPSWNNDSYWHKCGSPVYGGSTLMRSIGTAGMINSATYSSLDAVGTKSCKASAETWSHSVPMKNEAGITVPGSESAQKFSTVWGFQTDPSTVIVMKLVGELGQNLVKQAVTVKQKPKCQTCGRVNKATSKFCTECGTALVVI